MAHWFDVDGLDVVRLLAEWRWLCPEQMTLVARNAFGDLFLRDALGKVFWLDCAVGKFTEIADSEIRFREFANSPEKRQEWFTEAEEHSAAARGFVPNVNQCIGFSTPLIFAESGSGNKMYIVDIYEHASFLGDLNQQMSDCPDGSKVKLHVKSRLTT